MKLRIQSDSIRLRLRQAEVKALAGGSAVAERCATSPVELVYSLEPTTDDAMTVRLDGGRLTVRVPSAWLVGWETDERVGFSAAAGGLEILVEKDWKCINPADPKDNEDCFENPEPHCGT